MKRKARPEPTFTRPEVSLPRRKADDPRIGELVGTGLRNGALPALVLVGFPVERGVLRNGGRAGAAEAPDAIREALFRFTPDPEAGETFLDLVRRTLDLGNLVAGGLLAEAQERLGEAIAPYLVKGIPVVVLGGGHETTYGHFLGYVRATREVEILNWDAHPDVRELVRGKGHSGSPFRQILLHPSRICRSYTVLGLGRESTARAHLDFLREHGGRFAFRDQLSREEIENRFRALSGDTLVSFDLDAVDQAYAPGVSAPAARGLPSDLFSHAANLAGASEKVRSIDVVEVSPRLDRDGQTARLAALAVWEFLRGRASLTRS